MMFLENIMISAVKVSGYIGRLQRIVAHLRTHGKALKTEMTMKIFVMIPLAITAGC